VGWVFVQTIEQHTKEGFTFSHTLSKQKQKKTIKIKTPKNNIEKAKRGGKKNQQKKIEINKIFKNYRKKKDPKNKKKKIPKNLLKNYFK
jgi:hypothetical protein